MDAAQDRSTSRELCSVSSKIDLNDLIPHASVLGKALQHLASSGSIDLGLGINRPEAKMLLKSTRDTSSTDAVTRLCKAF